MVTEVWYIGLVIPDIIHPTIITMMVFVMMKFLKFLQVMEYIDIGLLRPATLPLAITAFFIIVTMLVVDLGLKRPGTLYILIVKFIILILMV